MNQSVVCLIALVFMVNTGRVCAAPAAEPNLAAFLALEEESLPPEPNLPPPPPADRMAAAGKLADAMDLKTALHTQAQPAYEVLVAPMSTFLYRQCDDNLDRIMKPYFEETRNRVLGGIDWQEVLNQTIEEYARTFTAAELNQLTTFYESPLGKRLVAQTPRIQQRGRSMVSGQVSSFYETLNQEFGRRLTEAYKTILLERRQKSGIVAGQKFPAFKGPCVDGSAFDSKVLNGKVTYMTSWAYQLTDWVQNLPRLRAIYDLFHKQGLEIVGFSLNYIDEQQERKEFLKANPMPWPNLAVGYDDGLEVSQLLALDGPPVSFLVGRDGVLIAIDPSLDELPGLIEKALKDQTAGPKPAASPPADSSEKEKNKTY